MFIFIIIIIATLVLGIVYRKEIYSYFSNKESYPSKCEIIYVKPVTNPGVEIAFKMPKNNGKGGNNATEFTQLKYLYVSLSTLNNRSGDLLIDKSNSTNNPPRIHLVDGKIQYWNETTNGYEDATVNSSPPGNSNAIEIPDTNYYSNNNDDDDTNDTNPNRIIPSCFTQKDKDDNNLYLQLTDDLAGNDDSVKWFSWLADEKNKDEIHHLKLNLPELMNTTSNNGLPYVNEEITFDQNYYISIWAENEDKFKGERSYSDAFKFTRKVVAIENKQVVMCGEDNNLDNLEHLDKHFLFIRNKKLFGVEQGFGVDRNGVAITDSGNNRTNYNNFSKYIEQQGNNTDNFNRKDLQIEQIWYKDALVTIEIIKVVAIKNYIFFIFDLKGGTPETQIDGCLAYIRRDKITADGDNPDYSYAEIIMLTKLNVEDDNDKSINTTELDIKPLSGETNQNITDYLANFVDLTDIEACLYQKDTRIILVSVLKFSSENEGQPLFFSLSSEFYNTPGNFASSSNFASTSKKVIDRFTEIASSDYVEDNQTFSRLSSSNNNICAINLSKGVVAECWNFCADYDDTNKRKGAYFRNELDNSSQVRNIVSISLDTKKQLCWINSNNRIQCYDYDNSNDSFSRINLGIDSDSTNDDSQIEYDINKDSVNEYDKLFAGLGENDICALTKGTETENDADNYAKIECITKVPTLGAAGDIFEPLHFEYIEFPTKDETCAYGITNSESKNSENEKLNEAYCWDNSVTSPEFTRKLEIEEDDAGWGEPGQTSSGGTNNDINATNTYPRIFCHPEQGDIVDGKCECKNDYLGDNCSFEEEKTS